MYWMPDILPAAVAVLVVLLVAWLWRRSDFVIRVRGGRVECRGKVPPAHRAELADFLLHELRLTDPVTILGRRHGRRVELWFRGRLSKADQQRIRNFFVNPV